MKRIQKKGILHRRYGIFENDQIPKKNKRFPGFWRKIWRDKKILAIEKIFAPEKFL